MLVPEKVAGLGPEPSPQAIGAEGEGEPVVLSVTPPEPDRMVARSEFARVEAALGVSFLYDAHCNSQGTNSLCPRYATPAQPFLDTDVAGEAIWCAAPPDVVRQYEQHYTRCKKKQPLNTCAAFLVPKAPHLEKHFRQRR